MKSHLTLFLTAVALLCLCACGNEPSEPVAPATPEELILGSWQLDSALYLNANGTIDNISHEYSDGYTITFQADGTFTTSDDNNTYAYHFSSNGQLVLDYTGYDYKEAFRILELTETTLIIEGNGEASGEKITLHLSHVA